MYKSKAISFNTVSLSSVLRTVALCVFAFGFSLASAQEFYRYKDDQGQTVLDTKIPAEYAGAGYDILDSRGRLIEQIAPVDSLSEEELIQLNQNLARQDSDLILLASYSTVGEIEAHRDRRLTALAREVSIIKIDQESVQVELDEAMLEASELDEGEELEAVTDLIASLNRTMGQLQDQLVRRQNEISETELEFGAMVARFQDLKSLQINQ